MLDIPIYQNNSLHTIKITPCQDVSELTYDNLINEFDSLYEGLKEAFRLSRNGKRKSKFIQNFENYLPKNLETLCSELLTELYVPEMVRIFYEYCKSGQKMRKILAPTFRDVVVQRYVYEKIYDIFDKTFIWHSFGCRKGKGMHKCAEAIKKFANSSNPNNYYLQLDIKKFYYNIDHEILKRFLREKIKDEKLIDLLMVFCTQNSSIGVNVGSVLAQLYALIYLNKLDHYIKHVLKIKKYARYVDDMIIMDITKEQAHFLHHNIEGYIKKNLKLELSKHKINKIKNGVNFTGVRTFFHYTLTRPKTYKNFYKSVKNFNFKSIESIFGMTQATNSYQRLVAILIKNINISSKCKNIPMHITRRIKQWQMWQVQKVQKMPQITH